MALSEHEEQLLQQMEEALYAEDPRFASRIRKTKSRHMGRARIVIGVVAGMAGLALVILSAMSSLIWLGAIGFAMMVAGIAYALSPGRMSAQAASGQGDGAAPEQEQQRRTSKGGPATANRGTFMERLEQRWEKRPEAGLTYRGHPRVGTAWSPLWRAMSSSLSAQEHRATSPHARSA